MRRDYFENTVPIDDALTVIDLLHSRWGDDTHRRIYLPRFRAPHRFYVEPYLEIRHVRDYGEDDTHKFRVTERVARELIDLHLVSGKKEWGRTDMHVLSINECGEAKLYEIRDRVGMPMDFRAEEWIQTRPWGEAPQSARSEIR